MSAWSDLWWYSKAKGWVKKRRKALLWAAAATGAGVCIYYGASWHRLRMREREEQAARVAILRKEAEDRVNARLQHHFEGIQNISDSTTLPSMLPHLRDRLFSLLDLSALTNMLTVRKRDPQALISTQEKVQLWNKLKILSFTRTASAMTALALLDLLIRIQINVLARHMYIETARGLSATGGRGFDTSYPSSWQQKFLDVSEFLPHRGIYRLVEDLQISVEEIMSSIPLTKSLDSHELKDLLARILANFLNQQREWESYLLPSEAILTNELESAVTEADLADSSDETLIFAEERHGFDILVAETRAILSSAEFQGIIEVALDIILNDAIIIYQESVSGDCSGGVPLARVIYPLTNLSDSFLEHSQSNLFVAAVARHPKVRSFCAMVYASSSQEI